MRHVGSIDATGPIYRWVTPIVDERLKSFASVQRADLIE